MSPDDQIKFFESAAKHSNLAEALYEVASDSDAIKGNHKDYFTDAALRRPRL